MPGKQFTGEPNEVNPKWKTVSILFLTISIIDEFDKAHPEFGFTSVNDFITSALREYPLYRRAVVEYMQSHNLKHISEAEIEAALVDAERWLADNSEKIKRVEELRASLRG